MCDCIIVDPNEVKISLAGLKHHRGRRRYDNVEHIRRQFEGSLDALRKIMACMQIKDVCLQLVLFTNGKFAYPSEQRKFVKPLTGFDGTIRRCACGDTLPNSYHKMSLPH